MKRDLPGATKAIGWTMVPYAAMLVLMSVTGFAQMPIFKRYYVADIPGLGWLAQFFVTHYLHYLGAAACIGLGIYVAAGFGLVDRRRLRLTASGRLRVVLLAAILISGAVLVVKNLPHVHMAAGWIIAFDLIHLSSVMVFLAVSAVCLTRKKGWTEPRQHPMKR